MMAGGSAPWLENDPSLRVAEYLVETSASCNFQTGSSKTNVSCCSLKQ